MSYVGFEAITTKFQYLIGIFKLQRFSWNTSSLQEWIETLQKKKRLIYMLTDKEFALLAFDKASGPVSKSIGGLCENDPEITWEELKKALVGRFAGERTALEAVRGLRELKKMGRETFMNLE